LSASVRLGKSSIHLGDKQTITVKAIDTDSTNPIAAASVSGTITSPDGLTKKFEDTTDYNGKASYSWKASDIGDAIGKYRLVVKVFAPGYENYIGSKTFNVNPIPVTTTSISNGNDNNNRPISSTSDNNNNNNSPPLFTTLSLTITLFHQVRLLLFTIIPYQQQMAILILLTAMVTPTIIINVIP
jgi:hypothetical protein